MPSRSSKRLRTVVVALSLAALVACGSDDGDPKATETPPPPGGDSAPPTTSSAQTGPTGCQARGAPASSEQAAQCLYAAWKEGNPERAAAVATPEAVSSLFREKWSPPDAAFEPCISDHQAGGDLCTYDYHGATYLVDVRREGGGWRVTQVQGPLGGE